MKHRGYVIALSHLSLGCRDEISLAKERLRRRTHCTDLAAGCLRMAVSFLPSGNPESVWCLCGDSTQEPENHCPQRGNWCPLFALLFGEQPPSVAQAGLEFLASAGITALSTVLCTHVYPVSAEFSISVSLLRIGCQNT